MSQSAKKIVGTLLILVILLVYCVVATVIATAFLAKSHWSVHLAYFAFTGILWVVPAMALIKWMAGYKSNKGKKGEKDNQAENSKEKVGQSSAGE